MNTDMILPYPCSSEFIGGPKVLFVEGCCKWDFSLLGSSQASRLSASKPDRGLSRIRQVTVNQRGEPVMEQETMVFLKRRPAP